MRLNRYLQNYETPQMGDTTYPSNVFGDRMMTRPLDDTETLTSQHVRTDATFELFVRLL